jgi:hypothetical protein
MRRSTLDIIIAVKESQPVSEEELRLALRKSNSGKGEALLPLPPLRTVLASCPAHGSSKLLASRTDVVHPAALSPCRQLCQDCINDFWIPAHLDDEQATAVALGWCRRAVLAERELLEVSTTPGENPTV